MNFKVQMTVCGLIVLGHVLSMRVIEMTDGKGVGGGRRVKWHNWSDHFQLLHAALWRRWV